MRNIPTFSKHNIFDSKTLGKHPRDLNNLNHKQNPKKFNNNIWYQHLSFDNSCTNNIHQDVNIKNSNNNINSPPTITKGNTRTDNNIFDPNPNRKHPRLCNIEHTNNGCNPSEQHNNSRYTNKVAKEWNTCTSTSRNNMNINNLPNIRNINQHRIM
jgi:hypothetical protein